MAPRAPQSRPEVGAEPAVRGELERLGLPSLWSLLGELMLYDESLRQALTSLPGLGGLPPDFASTDDHPYLEYQTPKGNMILYNTVEKNIRFMEQFRPPLLPPELRLRGLASENEKNLLLGYVAEARGDLPGALKYFGRVKGPGRARAALEAARLESRRPELH